MIGATTEPYAYLNYVPTVNEGFSPGTMSTNSYDNSRSSDMIMSNHSVREGLDNKDTNPMSRKDKEDAEAKRIYISGYVTATHCSDLSTINSNTGYMNECVNTIKSNIQAIEKYSTEYTDKNSMIDKNYNDILDMSQDVSGLYTSVNNPTITDIFGAKKDPHNIYDPIDFSGNLVYKYGTRSSPELKDAMLDDMNQEIVQQNAMYVMGTMTVASLLIFMLIISK